MTGNRPVTSVPLQHFEPDPADDHASGYGQFLTAPERETIVGLNDGEDTATIYSAQRVIINRLRKHPAAELIEEGTFGTSAWARFTIPSTYVTFRQPRVKRELTDEQRDAFRERMARSRASRAGQGDAADPGDAE
jgi:hypothetical protein